MHQGAPGISLRQLLPDAQFAGAGDLRVTSCCGDSRRCRRGDLFVAVRGTADDGHDYAAEAVHRGALAIVAEHPLPHVSVPVCVVPDSRAAFGRLCHALAGDPSQRVKVIGITGTNGKTTTAHLVASVLDAAGYNVGLSGTLGRFDGVQLDPASLTTPGAPVLANWLARCEANFCAHAVMEVSSHALAARRVAGIDFDVACFTNLRHDHLDFHGDIERYHADKLRLLDQLQPEGVVVANADDPGCGRVIDAFDGPMLTVGCHTAAELSATPLEQHQSEQTFLLSVGNESVPVRTGLIGRHNVDNCLIAAAVGFSYGLDLQIVVRGLEAVARVPGRLERIECGQPFGVFVDYAHTPDALNCVLRSLREVTRGRLICVFGAGGDRDRLKRPRMGRVVAAQADVAVITNDNPRGEDPAAIASDVQAGFAGGAAPTVILNRGEAIRWALSLARQGDCVLIAGKGHEDYQIIGSSESHFDDREAARTFLYEGSTTDEPYWLEPRRAA